MLNKLADATKINKCWGLAPNICFKKLTYFNTLGSVAII